MWRCKGRWSSIIEADDFGNWHRFCITNSSVPFENFFCRSPLPRASTWCHNILLLCPFKAASTFLAATAEDLQFSSHNLYSLLDTSREVRLQRLSHFTAGDTVWPFLPSLSYAGDGYELLNLVPTSAWLLHWSSELLLLTRTDFNPNECSLLLEMHCFMLLSVSSNISQNAIRPPVRASNIKGTRLERKCIHTRQTRDRYKQDFPCESYIISNTVSSFYMFYLVCI